MTDRQAELEQVARALLDTIEQRQGIRSISGYSHNLNEHIFIACVVNLLAAREAKVLEEAIDGLCKACEQRYFQS